MEEKSNSKPREQDLRFFKKPTVLGIPQESGHSLRGEEHDPKLTHAPKLENFLKNSFIWSTNVE